MTYATLKAEEIIKSIVRLTERIEDRFPGSGLGKVSGQLLEISRHMEERVRWIAKPVMWLRSIVWILAIGILVAFGTVAWFAKFHPSGWGGKDLVEVLDSGFNVTLLVGAAIFFLFSLESRYKRGRALEAIHELRSVAHIIDMHQLTKDPERLLNKQFFKSKVSPKMTMTQFELRRYLDYCSELLSLSGKIAAIYIQGFEDPAAVTAASEFEALSTGLSRKIWQKILILHTFVEDDAGKTKSMIDLGQ